VTPHKRQPHLPVILASASPRRAALLRQAGILFVTVPSAVEDDTPTPGVDAIAHVQQAALAKARGAASQVGEGLVIGADTLVVLEGEALGKPRDPEDAARMLRRLAGRTHQVVTGVALVEVSAGIERRASTRHERTTVTFRDLSDDDIQAYVATGEPLDKAGAYGIQGRGALLVSGIEGCYTNVVGLPLARLACMLRDFGLSPWQLGSE